jgi:Caspase domain
MTDLGWDPLRSRAVLIGTSAYQYLPKVGPAANSLNRMRKVLTSDLCGWPEDRVVVLANVEKPGELPDELVELFADAEDVALFYYVGHGLVDDLDNLCLCLANTRLDASRRRTTSLPFDAVRHAFRQCQAKTKIVILDCCYAGMAERRTLGHEALIDRARADGTFTMTAAGEFDLAWYETDPEVEQPQTYFTKYFLDVIENGVDGASDYLRLDVIFAEAQAALEGARKPVPTSSARHRAPHLVFAHNVHAGFAVPRMRPRLTLSNLATRSATTAEILDYDLRQDGLFTLGVWSPARRLEPSRLLTEVISSDVRPIQPYVDHGTLTAAVEARSRRASGATVYLTGFNIDHRESDETQYCRIREAPSAYPEVLAIEDLRVQRPELFEDCDKAIEDDVRGYLSNAVPSSLAVNLVVVSAENDELLSVERSAATDSAVGWWTIGVFETMKQAEQNRPGSQEDLYGLAVRGLEEELGLRHGDYNPIQISWAGIYRPILRGHVVAVLKLRISKAEVHERARGAHSGYEHAAIDWIPLRRSLVQSFIQAERSFHLNKVGFTLEVMNRKWIDQTRLSVLEAWRFRNALDA